MFFEGDLLYLSAREQGVCYAIEDQRVTGPRFKNHFGARAVLGFTSSHDEWTIELQGLHFHARTREEKQGPLLPTQTHPLRAEGTTASSALSCWRLHLGFVDLLLSRPFPWITPFFGIKFAGIRHKSRVDYLQLGGFSDEGLSMKNKYWGIGPEMGVSSEWAFTEHFGLYGRAAAAILFGRFYLHQDEEDEENPLLGKMKYLDEFWLSRAYAESGLGLFYRHCFASSFFELRGGWQAYLFSGQNQAARFVSHSAPALFFSNLGDLTLQGWSLGLLFNF